MKHSVKVSIHIPQGMELTLEDVIEYVHDAVLSHRGMFAPDNKFYQLNDNEFKTTRIYRNKSKKP